MSTFLTLFVRIVFCFAGNLTNVFSRSPRNYDVTGVCIGIITARLIDGIEFYKDVYIKVHRVYGAWHRVMRSGGRMSLR